MPRVKLPIPANIILFWFFIFILVAFSVMDDLICKFPRIWRCWAFGIVALCFAKGRMRKRECTSLTVYGQTRELSIESLFKQYDQGFICGVSLKRHRFKWHCHQSQKAHRLVPSCTWTSLCWRRGASGTGVVIAASLISKKHRQKSACNQKSTYQTKKKGGEE